jgi:hypothetical protein
LLPPPSSQIPPYNVGPSSNIFLYLAWFDRDRGALVVTAAVASLAPIVRELSVAKDIQPVPTR